MLTLFTVKKILFFGTLGTGIFGPIIGTSPIIREFAWGGSEVSPLKEGIYDLTKVNIYDEVSIPDFLKQTLMYKEGQEVLVDSFSQELARRWYFSQPPAWTAEQRADWDKLQNQQFQEAWREIKPKNPQRDFWDNYWGSKENMDSFWLRHNSHKLVKNFLTSIKKTDFSLNVSWDWKTNHQDLNGDLTSLFSRKTLVNDEEIENSANWSKIGFFPSKARKHQEDKEKSKFILGKYHFVNWSFRKWFDRTLPLYFWKISWHYNKNATTSDLETEYNRTILKDGFPQRANYAFPIFSPQTIEKFKSFINQFPEGNGASGQNGGKLDLDKYSVENWKGDQTSPAILLEVLNSFNNVTPEYASTASYLVSKALNGTSGQSSVAKNDSKIHELKGATIKAKNGDLDKPISIFFDENGQSNSNGKQLISFDSNILTNGKTKKHKHIYDVRETDTGWIFFRDEEGVHALALDGHRHLTNGKPTTDKTDSKEKLFNWFSFRNLQSSETRRGWYSGKKFLNLSEKDNWFSRFTDYLNQNFDKLLAEYYIEDQNNKPLFELLKPEDKKYFDLYKEVFNKLFGLWKTNEWNSKIFQLRRQILERYSFRDWSIGYAKTIQSIPQQGLSSPFPFETDFSDKDKERFPSQEKVFKEFLKPSEGGGAGSPPAVPVSSGDPAESEKIKDSQLFIDYFRAVKTLLDNKEINLTIRSNGFDFRNSQRLFVFDRIFDFILDKLFSNKDLVNYQVKEWQLLHTGLLNDSNLLKQKKGDTQEKENLPWLAPIHVEGNLSQLIESKPANAPSDAKPSSADGKCWECDSFTSGGENQKNKENLHSLLNRLLKTYFFKTYLKVVREDYFDFLADFPEGRSKSSDSSIQIQGTSGAGTKFNFLFDDLFNKWRETYLLDVKGRNNFLDFLITLNYLSRDGFEGLREAMKIELALTTNYHYLLFEGVSKNKKQKDKQIHPFLINQKDSEKKDFFSNQKEAKQYIREGWRTIGELDLNGSVTNPKSGDSKKEAMFKKLMNEQSNLPDNTNNLFNFKGLKELIDWIKGISSPTDFDKLVTFIAKVHKKINAEFYRGDKFFTAGYKEQKMFLDEKKKLLVHQLLDSDQGPFYSSQELKGGEEIIKKDIDSMVKEAKLDQNSPSGSKITTVSALATQDQNNKKHLEQKYFERTKGSTKDGGYFIQVSSRDFQDTSTICAFFNLLPTDLLAEFLMIETDKPLNKEKAQDYFFKKTSGLKIRDMKFKSYVDSRHIE